MPLSDSMEVPVGVLVTTSTFVPRGTPSTRSLASTTVPGVVGQTVGRLGPTARVLGTWQSVGSPVPCSRVAA